MEKLAIVDYQWQAHGYSGLVTRGFFRRVEARQIKKAGFKRVLAQGNNPG